MTDFDALYSQNPDPWQVRSSWYERRKRNLLLACLPKERYKTILELGCGTGEMTACLAQRAAIVRAVDLSHIALSRCHHYLETMGIYNVETSCARVPETWPVSGDAAFDLLVISEFAYYLEDREIDDFIEHCQRSLTYGGDWLMCHYLPSFHDRRQDTMHLHQRITDALKKDPIVSHHDEVFLLNIWRKTDRGEP